MEHKRTLYLRIDVDFRVGLRKGVPYILDVLREIGGTGTFFVVMGPDTLPKHLLRLKQQAHRRRLVSMNLARLINNFGIAVLRSLFFRQMVGPDSASTLHQIVANDCEIGIHGYDHAYWADHCFELGLHETTNEIDRALAEYAKLFPEKDWTWGAPNWRCNTYMFEHLASHNVQYSSDVRGVCPFYPVVNGRKSSVLQLPINLPCLHEIARYGISKECMPDFMAQCAAGAYNLWCIHDYYEGMLQRRLFVNVISRLADEGFAIKPLSSAYASTEEFGPLESELDLVHVPGGSGFVSCQREFLEENYFSLLEHFVARL